MKFKEQNYKAELIIVGAGFPGIVAAIQAARQGIRVALINDRGVLGGNSGAEIGVSVDGATDGGQLNLNSREGGICSEILLEYFHRTPQKRNRYIFDGVLIDFVDRENNIKVFLNTCIDEARTKDNRIISVSGTQNTTETRWNFIGRWFVDDTGDGTLGSLAGADFMLGREGKDKFNESIAPDKADKYVIPSTLSFFAFDAGYKIPYTAPDFAFDLESTGALDRREISQETFHKFNWYYEIAGEYDHVMDREEIIKDHKRLVYGIWDYIKNSGKYPQAENYDLEYVACIPGTREYRRLTGDYTLSENDIIAQNNHRDTVGHGGWNIDLHAIKGFFDEDIVNKHINFNGIYKIPFRTGYSRNIDNMFMCGRCMSASHVAFGSVRVSATLSTLGQAVGMAAALCKKHDTDPRGIYENHIQELRQLLLKEDQLIVGCINEDPDDLAMKASVNASSTNPLSLSIQKNTNIEELLVSQGREYILDSIKSEGQSNTVESGLSLDFGYLKKFEGFTDCKRLDSILALSIPVKERLDALNVLVKSRKDTKLKYNVYLPRVPENYGPDILYKSGTVDISAHSSFDWVSLPVNLETGGSYVLIEFLENPEIEMGVGGEPLPNTMMFRSYINKAANIIDYETLQMSERIWLRAPLCICYETLPLQDTYNPGNVVNGYNRAFKGTNMWLSDINDKQPEIRLSWESQVELEELRITFAIDTTKRLEHEVFTETMDFIAHDYDIYIMNSDKEKLVTSIKNNFKKVNIIHFEKTTADAVVFKFSKSNTGQIGVYEIRAY